MVSSRSSLKKLQLFLKITKIDNLVRLAQKQTEDLLLNLSTHTCTMTRSLLPWSVANISLHYLEMWRFWKWAKILFFKCIKLTKITVFLSFLNRNERFLRQNFTRNILEVNTKCLETNNNTPPLIVTFCMECWELKCCVFVLRKTMILGNYHFCWLCKKYRCDETVRFPFNDSLLDQDLDVVSKVQAFVVTNQGTISQQTNYQKGRFSPCPIVKSWKLPTYGFTQTSARDVSKSWIIITYQH